MKSFLSKIIVDRQRNEEVLWLRVYIITYIYIYSTSSQHKQLQTRDAACTRPLQKNTQERRRGGEGKFLEEGDTGKR